MNIKDDFILKEINEGYLVGGSIRDFLLGKNFIDRDIAIFNAENYAKKIAEKFDATLVVLDEENKIYRVVFSDKINFLDISEIHGKSIEEDLLRRDFTINAIAYDLQNGNYIDTTGGIKDLNGKILRHIKDSNFEDDPLRILRAFRFKAITGFEFSEELKSAIKKYSSLVLKPSPERINYELMKLFGGEYTSDTLYLMDEYQILDILFPFVKELKKIPPNTHHHLDLFHHSIETVRNIQDQYMQSDVIKKHLDKIDFGGFERINHLKLAGFMHDIGKFSTWTIEEDTGRHRFIKHDDIGAKLSIGFLKNLKFSKKQIGYISEMIKFHIYPSSVVSAPELTEKIMMRYLRKMSENVIDNIILAKSDRLSAQGEAITEEILNNNLNSLNLLLTFYLEKKDTLKPLPKLLDGFEIMQILNLTPSPRLGEIIDELKEAQINGDVITKDDAVNFIKEYKFKN